MYILIIFNLLISCQSQSKDQPKTQKVGNLFEIDAKNREERSKKIKSVYKDQLPTIFYTFTGQQVRPCAPFRETLSNKCPPQVFNPSYLKFIQECASGETSLLLRCSCDTYICSEKTSQVLK